MHIRSFATLLLLAVSLHAQDGKDIFEKRCTGCHALDGEHEGPHLRGVVGRAAGSVAGFHYSKALQNSHITWDEATLDRWLTDPDSVVKDNDMAFRVLKAEERTAIIQYLKTLSDHSTR
jgi:cytochrome c